MDALTVDGSEIEFSDGFTDLHTLSYKQILNGNGNKLDSVRPSIKIVSDIRKATSCGITENCHPLICDIIKGE